MAIRTTANAVEGIIVTEVESASELDPFIETASALVDEVCATALKDDGSAWYDAARLELIERWLSAHFYAILSPRAESERAGPVAEKIETKVDLGLQVTRYGQQVLILDTYGGLARLNKQANEGSSRKVGAFWLGTEEDS